MNIFPANSSNTIGVGFFPGHFGINPQTGNIEGDEDLDLARSPTNSAMMRQSGIVNQIQFRPYDGSAAKDVWCAAVAQSASAPSDLHTPNSILSSIPNSDRLVVPSEYSTGWEVNRPRESEFQVSEVVWAKAAQDDVSLNTVSSIKKGLLPLAAASPSALASKIASRNILMIALCYDSNSRERSKLTQQKFAQLLRTSFVRI